MKKKSCYYDVYKRIKQHVLNNLKFITKVFNGLLCLSIGKRFLLKRGMGNGKIKLDISHFPYTLPPPPFPIFPFSNIRKRSITDNLELSVTMHSFCIFSD